jgi:hypothetical protein
MYVKVSSLPASVQRALMALHYAKADISVTARERFSVVDGGATGRRAFVCVVNLESGESKTLHGSWGGANMFNPSNAVDLDDTMRPLLPNMVVIRGSEGNSVYASIEVAPVTLAPMLPAAPTVDDRDAGILCAYRSFKSGPYRNEELARLSCTDADLDRLAAAGFLKRSKNGATQITTDGKNAVLQNRR